MADQLYINGKQIEIKSSTVIAMSFQVNDLAELKDRQANFSNQFEVDKTDENRRILEFSDILTSTTRAPYKFLPAKLIQSGIETVPNGVAIIEQASDTFSITLYSGIFDFFSRIDGKKLSELNLSDLNIEWSAAGASGSIGNTDGVLFPILQTGLVPTTGNNFDILYQMPVFYVHDLIDRIFSSVGFQKSGNIFNNEFYKSLVISSGSLTATQNQQWVDDRSSQVEMGTENDGSNNSSLFIPYDTEISDGARNNFNTSSHSYVADVPMYVNVKMTSKPGIAASIGAANATLSLLKNGVAIASISTDPLSGPIQRVLLEIDQTLYLAAGDELSGFMEFEGTTSIYDYTWNLNVDLVDGNERSFIITPTNQIAFGSTLNASDIVPDMEQKDLIKAVLGQMFGCIFQANNLTNILEVRQFKEIPANKANAVNWTSKLDPKINPVIKYRIGKYGQTNNLTYKVDQSEEDLLSGINKGLGNGTIIIEDETLPISVNLFELPFAASPSTTVLGNTTCAVMTRFNGSDTLNPEPRIFSIKYQTRDIRYINQNGTYIDVVAEEIPVAYFIDDTQTYSLGFNDNLKESNLKDLEEGVLNRTKDYTASFNLDVNDIQALDFFTPVFLEQENEYFYINLINEFLENKSTECELIRL